MCMAHSLLHTIITIIIHNCKRFHLGTDHYLRGGGRWQVEFYPYEKGGGGEFWGVFLTVA